MESEQVGVAVEPLPDEDEYLVATAGQSAVGEFRCAECGYGVFVQRALPPCPMCSGATWMQSPWSPFSRGTAAGRLF